MMKFLFVAVCVIAGIALSTLYRNRIITPDSIVLAVKMNGKPWIRCVCCIRDAKHDGYRYAALSNRQIVDLETMRRTGRKYRSFPRKEVDE